MKNFHPIIFALVLSGSLLSCSSRNMGFFNTTNPRQAVKHDAQDNPSPKNRMASAQSTEVAKPGTNLSYAGSPAEEPKISKSKPNAVSADLDLPKNVLGTSANVSKEEKAEVKNYIKEALKQNKKMETGLPKGLLVIIAILLPPVAVALVDGFTGPFWLSILLTLLFYLPGLIYALFRIFRAQ